MQIIIKKYQHVNRSFAGWDTPKGKYISSKKQYDEEMKKGGFVGYEEGRKVAEQVNSKSYNRELSPKAKDVIKAARLMSDRKGKIKPSDKLIDAMKEVGVNFNKPKFNPGE